MISGDGPHPPLSTHGDSRQRKWIAALGKGWTQYEPFWQHFILPLTFQAQEPGNFFVRPTLPDELIDLADTNYAVFFHLAQMHEWKEHARRSPEKQGIGSTEAVYCFFSHGWSLLDATRSFAHAVNDTLARYGCAPCFDFHEDDYGNERYLGDQWGMSSDRANWQRLVEEIRKTRNFLVHKRPVFVQSRFIPKEEYLEAMSGLTAISRVARDRGILRERFVELIPTLEGILEQAAKALDGVWSHALGALRAVECADFERERREVRKGDRKLTKQMILAARTFE